MRKLLFLLGANLLLIVFAKHDGSTASAIDFCYTRVCQDWIRFVDGPLGQEEGFDVAIDETGNIYVSALTSIGTTDPNGNTQEYWLVVAYDNAGDELWRASLPPPSGYRFGVPSDLAIDADGNVFVTGWFAVSTTNLDAVTARFDSGGALRWVRTYAGLGNRTDYGWAIATDELGDVYISGKTQSTTSDTGDLLAVKYDGLTGNEEWATTYSDSLDSSEDARTDIVVAAGAVYIAGTFFSAATDSGPYPQQSLISAKYDADTGQILWIAREDGQFAPEIPAGMAYAAQDIAMAPDGALFVSACLNYFTEPYLGTGYNDILLIKYDSADGEKVWQAEYHNLVCGNAPMAIEGSGDVVMASGAGTPDFFSRNWLTLKFDGTTGQLRWSIEYDGANDSSDSAYEVASDPSGNAYVTGTTDGDGSTWDGLTIKYDGSDGHLVWEARYGQSSNTVFDAVAADPYGGVVVTGGSQHDLITIRYLQDIDGDLVPDESDNCPINLNSDQTNFDLDTLGDVCDPDDDNDGVLDLDEISCGANSLSASSRPERLDGVFAGLDDDGDAQIDEPVPNGSGTFDCDGDGWKGDDEKLVYNDATSTATDQDACGNDGWTADLSGSDNLLNAVDFNSFLFPLRADGSFNKFGHPVPDPDDDAIARWNLEPNAAISIADINALNPAVIASTARPPMFGGLPAFFTNGGVCPWPP